jgi:Flp pilus assembly protein TadD
LATSFATAFGRREVIVAAFLTLATMVVFVKALGCDFVNYDDPEYVTSNSRVRAGLTGTGLYWALTAFDVANWHPLTWLSLQLDASLWNLDPRGYHLTNVLLHTASVVLLFLALRSLTGALWCSAAVALLYAVHPLRVEPVAWIAERKGVLSVFFGMLALWAYARYVRAPGVLRYLAVLVALALSLMSKPALVTFPFLMLVLDWWPLGRAQTLRDWRRLAVEKLPMFGLVLAFSVIAYWTQSGKGALGSLQMYPLVARLANAAVSYAVYIYLTFVPINLAVLYPHPGVSLPLWKVAGALTLLAVVTSAAILLRRRAPYLLTGWLWYLGSLVPVIGLVQVGGVAYADRYCYFPHVGILLILCWGVADLAAGRPRIALALAAVVAVLLAAQTNYQLSFWSDSVQLWEHDIKIAGGVPRALNNLGVGLQERGRTDDALVCYQESVRLDPTYRMARANLANLLRLKGRLDEAAREYDEILRQEPARSTAYCDYADVESRRNRLDQAVALYQKALELDPGLARAHAGLGLALIRQKNSDLGLFHLREAVRCDAREPLFHTFLGKELEKRGEIGAAAEQFEQAVRLNPTAAGFWADLGRIRRR